MQFTSADGAKLTFRSQVAERDLAPRGIRANVIPPGPIDTGLAPTERPVADMLKAHLALARYGTVDEGAAAVAFLVGPEAASPPTPPSPSMAACPPD
jgi:NAD(P)-dependent dehydrogenase (short-subunit alcohol dehydrogenase family)